MSASPTADMKRDLTHDKVAGVVVTYHPDELVAERLKKIADQVALLIIVDNGSNPQALTRLKNFVAQCPHGELIANDENLGVATALNQGARRANEHQAHWLLMMDQDSIVFPNLVETLLGVVAIQPDPSKVGIVATRFQNADGTISAHYNKMLDADFQDEPFVITSGSLTPLRLWRETGGLKDELFIDLVDFDYCIRVRARGYRILLSNKPLMQHSLGDFRQVHVLWKGMVFIPYYSPTRRYYTFRNRFVLLKWHWRVEPRWLMGRMLDVVSDIVFVLLYEKERVEMLRAMFLGIIDGISGRLGVRRVS